MIDLHDIRYVRLGCSDLDESVRFATDILGLELTERADGRAYVRGDQRAYNICYVEGDPSYEVVAFEVASAGALARAAEELAAHQIAVHRGTEAECAERKVGAFVNFRDPNGNEIDLVHRPHGDARRCFPSRDAGITEFGHVGLHTRDPKRDARFWTEVMGARPSDWIGEAPLLRIDEVHHKIALFASQRSGIQHVNFQVATVDDIMRSWYFLQERGIEIVFGPGRHPTSTAVFLYFTGPDGRTYEFSSGVRRITDEAGHVPRQFPPVFSSFCSWGAKPNIAEFRKP